MLSHGRLLDQGHCSGSVTGTFRKRKLNGRDVGKKIVEGLFCIYCCLLFDCVELKNMPKDKTELGDTVTLYTCITFKGRINTGNAVTCISVTRTTSQNSIF